MLKQLISNAQYIILQTDFTNPSGFDVVKRFFCLVRTIFPVCTTLDNRIVHCGTCFMCANLKLQPLAAAFGKTYVEW